MNRLQNTMARWIAVPVEDEVEAGTTRSFAIILLGHIAGGAGGTLIMVVIGLLNPDSQAALRIAVLPGIAAVASMLAYWLLRRGNVSAAVYLVAFSLVTTATITIHLMGGVTGPASIIYLWAIAIAGFVPRERAGSLVLAVSCLAYAGLVVLEQTGLLPKADIDAATLTWGSLAVVIFMLSLVSLVIRLLSNSLRQALQEAHLQLDKNGRLVRQLQNTAEQTAGQLAPMAEELAATMEQMNAAAEQVAVTASQMSQGAESQARQAEEAAHSAAQLSTATGQIAGNARQTGDASTQAQKTVQDSARIVKVLGDRLDEIKRMVTLVDKIADQTNLLSLNASIEAARAGEHGAGFAVVADEVRRLAEHSATSVGEIAALSREIGSRLEEVLAAMEEAQGAVRQTATLAQETAAATEEQERATEAVVGAINEVATVAEENAAASEEIATSIEEQVASLEQIAGSAQQLAELVAGLQRSLEIREEG